jgi:hypothetical protein
MAPMTGRRRTATRRPFFQAPEEAALFLEGAKVNLGK